MALPTAHVPRTLKPERVGWRSPYIDLVLPGYLFDTRLDVGMHSLFGVMADV